MKKHFTLAELLIGIGIFALLFGGMYLMMGRTNEDASVMTSRIELQSNIRTALLTLENDLKNAKELTVFYDSSGGGSALPGYGETPLASTSVNFIMPDMSIADLSFKNSTITLTSSGNTKTILDNVSDCKFLVRSQFLVDYCISVKETVKTGSESHEEYATVASSIFLENSSLYIIKDNGPILENDPSKNANKLKHMNATMEVQDDMKLVHFTLPDWTDNKFGMISFNINPVNIPCRTTLFYGNQPPDDAPDDDHPFEITIDSGKIIIQGRSFFEYLVGILDTPKEKPYSGGPLALDIRWDANKDKVVMRMNDEVFLTADLKLPDQENLGLSFGSDASIENFEAIYGLQPPGI